MGHGTRNLARCFGGPFEGAKATMEIHGNPHEFVADIHRFC